MCHQRGTTTVSETTLEYAQTQSPWHRDPENLRNLSKSSLGSAIRAARLDQAERRIH